MFPCASIPRPEHPRPDRQRGQVEGVDWLNLNGHWQFRFDLHRRGVEEHWFDPAGPDWREQIVVPFCWESLAAWGEGDTAGDETYFSPRVFVNPLEVSKDNHRSAPRYEVGWYRRTIAIPDTAPWRRKRAIMTVGAADFFTDVWCNGVHLCHHEGGYVPIEVDLTDALRPAGPDGTRQGVVVIRVEDPMDNREQPVGKQWGWYTTTSGIWQTVFVEPRHESHISHFRILPDIDAGRASFEVFCAHTADDMSVVIDIVPPDAPPHRITLKLYADVATGVAEVDPVTLWDPSSPQLYRVIFRLVNDDSEFDVIHGYFGMRKISTAPSTDANAPAMLCLNNKPIYLRGALYQSYHCDGIYTATDARTLRNDIAFAREAGFDFLRVHIKLDDPILLYYADSLGILLMQDFPNFGEGGDTPLGRRRFEEMMRAGIQRDFNHPSIIAWCLFNETWGFGGQTELMKLIGPDAGKNPSAQAVKDKLANQTSFQWVHRMWEIAKTIDGTRLIEDMSVVVWEHLTAYGHVDTDINSWHFYIDDYDRARSHIANVVSRSYRGSSFNYIEGFQQQNAPLINSEYGGIGALDGNRDASWSFKFLTNELRRHPQLSAYIYTELTDVEWEYNGMLTYDRTPKEFGYHPTLVNQGDVLPIDAAPIRRQDPGAPVTVDVYSSHFSRRRRDNIVLQWLYSGVDTLGTVHSTLARGRAAIDFTHHRVELAQQIPLITPNEPMLCTLSVAAVTPAGEPVASNFIQHFVSSGPAPAREERGDTLVLRAGTHAWAAGEWSDGGCSREEAERLGYCFGRGAGFFEWVLADEALREIGRARRVRLLCEVSARREGTQQTSAHKHPSAFELHVNDLCVHRGVLPDHPHDTRGSLSYLRGGLGSYGYLMRVTLEDSALERAAAECATTGQLRFRCLVPIEAAPRGGLTVYGYDTGRFPIPPTVVVEWARE
ncbi:sugar-binding domain-containing protein [Opitutus sp. ER46]|uniref:glycoside hydrolase family 2 protein n=1 Tax=Opitutus sp. ER46 TaxID=2161864 RepID=UPI000D2F585F|nr:sugar-binding domain-containing protein [Opitutus sp. ER46]PTY00332.1 glycoside hydrolase family 2 [Opitutus sp. ER46]